MKSYPTVIQGGMGMAVSSWRLAQAVSRSGQLGVVSGTALDTVLIRRLNDGDPDGHMRRALAVFPFPHVAEWLVEKYYKPFGRKPLGRYQSVPMPTDTLVPSLEQVWAVVAGNFCEVWLAKQGHQGQVGVNLLEKIQNPLHNISLYGAMLAGVDFVLMGAGIPRQIMGVLSGISRGEVTSYEVDMEEADGSKSDPETVEFDPELYQMTRLPYPLTQPQFLAIISSDTLAKWLEAVVDGFVIEGPNAGGHNAPPRKKGVFNDDNEPMYGPKDVPNLEAIAALGKPFWLAGEYNTPEQLQAALALGATGIQVGTGFALSDDSGLDPMIRAEIRRLAYRGELKIFRDGRASPTGYPINIPFLEGTNAEPALYMERDRVCNLGYLRTPYRKSDGTIGFRCPAEPVSEYLKKGGKEEDTVGRKCICNGLCAVVSMAQVAKDGKSHERPIATLGKDVSFLPRIMRHEDEGYTASVFLNFLLSQS